MSTDLSPRLPTRSRRPRPDAGPATNMGETALTVMFAAVGGVVRFLLIAVRERRSS